MAITTDNGKIVYTEPPNRRRSEASGVVVDSEFAICDQTNVLKQIQFEVVPTTAAKGTLTISCDIGGDATIGLVANVSNTTWYNADQIHLNSTGHGIAKTYITNAINTVAA